MIFAYNQKKDSHGECHIVSYFFQLRIRSDILANILRKSH